MIAYFATSAVVPILIEEPSSANCRRLWGDADRCVSCLLTYAEVAAALSTAQRLDRISATEHDAAWANFLQIWPGLDVVEVTAELVSSAAALSRAMQLRGYDAVHCAAAAALCGDDVVDVLGVAGDSRLLKAWAELGLSVVNTNHPG